MGERRVVDLSRFLLFEAAGDSEADLDANRASFGLVDDQGNAFKGNGDDDDDAESCSNDVGYCTSSHIREARVETLEKNEQPYHAHYDDDDEDLDDGERNDIHGVDRHCRRHRRHHHHHHVHDDDDMKEEGEEMVSEVASTANSYASSKCARSSKRIRKMSEIEKSRLFWEACLAS